MNIVEVSVEVESDCKGRMSRKGGLRCSILYIAKYAAMIMPIQVIQSYSTVLPRKFSSFPVLPTFTPTGQHIYAMVSLYSGED